MLLNAKAIPEAKKGDIVEIYHPEDQNPRLLLQIKLFKEDLQISSYMITQCHLDYFIYDRVLDNVSVEQSIAQSFGLKTYKDVCVNLVNGNDVALDSIELTFKDQYMGRSDMWRLKKSLVS